MDWERLTVDKNFSHWTKRRDRFYPTNVTHSALPSGIYETRLDNEENVFAVQIEFPADSLIRIPGTPTDYILEQIKDFWNKKDLFRDLGLIYKRGVLLYGPAGCGKTSIIRLLCDEVIARNGVMVSISDIETTQSYLLKLREIEPNRPIMTIFEDIEGLMEKSDEASKVLSFLDGEKQLDNIVHLATTNKPDVLEDRLLRRPGRFDLVIGLNPPIAEAREKYINHVVKDKLPQEQIQRMIRDTDGLGLSHLRELIVATLCFEIDYESTLKRLKGNIKDEIKVPKLGVPTGFTMGFTPDENKKSEESSE